MHQGLIRAHEGLLGRKRDLRLGKREKGSSVKQKEKLKLKMTNRAEATRFVFLPEEISTARHRTEAPEQGRPSAFSFSSRRSLGAAESPTAARTDVRLVLHTGPGLMLVCRIGSEYSPYWEG